jgi:hypothetical protein
MRSEKKAETRSVNPVQAQIKSLSGAILTIIDATYHDPCGREAVKSLIKAEFRRKMDLLTLEWIATFALKLTHIEPTDISILDDKPEEHPDAVFQVNPEEYTEEERKRLQELEEEVVEVDGVEFTKDTLTERVVVDGVEFETLKDSDPTNFSPCVLPGIKTRLTDAPTRHIARANEVAEAEPNPFAKSLCKQCQDPTLKGVHTCAEGVKRRKRLTNS